MVLHQTMNNTNKIVQERGERKRISNSSCGRYTERIYSSFYMTTVMV